MLIVQPIAAGIWPGNSNVQFSSQSFHPQNTPSSPAAVTLQKHKTHLSKVGEKKAPTLLSPARRLVLPNRILPGIISITTNNYIHMYTSKQPVLDITTYKPCFTINLCRARLPTSERAATKTEPRASRLRAVWDSSGGRQTWPGCCSSANSGQVSSGPFWPQNNRTSWPEVVRPIGAMLSSVCATRFCRSATKLAVSTRQAGSSAETPGKSLPEKANSTCNNLLVLARFLGGRVGSGWTGRTRHLPSIC